MVPASLVFCFCIVLIGRGVFHLQRVPHVEAVVLLAVFCFGLGAVVVLELLLRSVFRMVKQSFSTPILASILAWQPPLSHLAVPSWGPCPGDFRLRKATSFVAIRFRSAATDAGMPRVSPWGTFRALPPPLPSPGRARRREGRGPQRSKAKDLARGLGASGFEGPSSRTLARGST